MYILNKFLFLSTLAVLSVITIAADEPAQPPVVPSTTIEIIKENTVELVANDDRSEGSEDAGCGCDGHCPCHKTV